MAKRDIIKYYQQVQNQYLEMLSDMKDFDEALKLGKVEQSQFDQAQNLVNKLKENYERLTYVMVLLNKPNKKSKKHKYERQNKNVISALKECDADAISVLDEGADVLKQFKQLVKQVKGQTNNG